MKLYSILQFLLISMLYITSSQALFFNYPKNALVKFFDSLREKKELKKPPPDIHHYHLHYYPVHVQSIHTHSSLKSAKAPNKHELESLHTNKLENYGWSEQEFRYIPDPVLRFSRLPETWSMSESHVYNSPQLDWDSETEEKLVDRHGEESVGKSGAGILLQVPLHQQIILQQPIKVEKEISHPLLAFFDKLNRWKNSIFQTDNIIEDKSDKLSDNLNAFVVYTNPNGRRLR